MGYSFLEHAADVKFRAEGETIQDVFVFAVEALNDTIRGDIEISEEVEKVVEIEGSDKVSLMRDFLSEFLVLLDSEDFLVSRVKEIEIDDEGLRCVVLGDSAEKYSFTNDVKAVTYSEMYVREKEDGKGWECQVVLDV
jgi:SHS2 domain-containing protein